MWFLPYKKLILKTHLSQEQVINKMREVIYIHGIFGSVFFITATSNRPYHGKFDAGDFEIRRLDHHDAYHPIIKGTIRSAVGGTNISITMKPNIFILGFLASFLVMFFYLFCERVILGFFNSGRLDFNDFIAFGLILTISYLFPMFVFNSESTHSKTFFQNLLETYDLVELSLFHKDNLA